MFDRFDPRDRDDDPRDGHDIYDPRWDNDPRDRDEDERERARDRDPRDAFVEGLDLPSGLEREIVLDERERPYELNGEDSRTLATVGAFRVVSETDLRDPPDDDHRHLRDQGLVRSVSLDGRDRVVTLTERGRNLLECHRRDRHDEGPRREGRRQKFYAGVSRPRELTHDASLYRAYLRAEKRLREQGADIRRVVLENDLKREYQEWLQEHNRGRSDSDGRPDRDAREIEDWAREHDLPYFDESVHFPDFRLEYELDARDRHEDIEVVTDNYRGDHAADRARAGFTCYSGGGRGGGRPFDPRVAEDFV
jgi:DNA-binding MarR family transcriptional regulator